MATYFGQPAATNRWFGNELIIPSASSSPELILPDIPAPPPGPLPGYQSPGYQSPGYRQYAQADGGSGPNTGPGSAGNFGGYMTPATVDPATGKYGNIGYDPNPTLGKVAAALTFAMNPFGLQTIGAVDKAFTHPAIAALQALGITEAPAPVGAADDTYGPTAPTIGPVAASMAQDAMGADFGQLGTVDSGRAATRAAAVESLAANPMQAVSWGAGTFGGTKDQIGLDYDVETGSAGPGASSGEGTVLCGALYSHGLLPEEVYRSDQEYGRELGNNDPDVMSGYQAWAVPIANLMKRSRTLSAVLSVLILPWAHEIHGNSNWLGRFYVKAGIPVCRWNGKRIRVRNRTVVI